MKKIQKCLNKLRQNFFPFIVYLSQASLITSEILLMSIKSAEYFESPLSA